MSGYLTKIKTKIPFSDKEVDINVDGKTLILTGGNGCGKTQLLRYVFEKLNDRIVKKDNSTLENLEGQKKTYENLIGSVGQADQSYDAYLRHLETVKQKIDELKYPPVTVSELEDMILKYKDFRAVLLSFEASRKSDILKPSSVSSLDSLKKKDKNTVTSPHQQKTSSSIFEEFLVTSIANQAFSESKKINNNPEEATVVVN